MESMGMLQTAAALFAIAAAGGLVMAGIRMFGTQNPPAWLAMLHGLLAGAGLTLMLYAALTVGIPSLALWALVLLVVAALGGILMNLGYHWKLKPLPKPLMFAHAGIAVVGFLLLLVAVMV